jgi:hypothetical protein
MTNELLSPADSARSNELGAMLDEQLARLEMDYLSRTRVPETSEDEDCVNWFLGEDVKLDAMEDIIKRNSKALLDAIAARRKAKAMRWGGQFKAAVDRLLKAKGGKTLKTLFGNAGYRKSQIKIVVNDEAAAIDWALSNCPEAVKTVLAGTAPLKKAFEASGEAIPGVEVIDPKDQFYPAVEPKSFGMEMWPALPGKEMSDANQ